MPEPTNDRVKAALAKRAVWSEVLDQCRSQNDEAVQGGLVRCLRPAGHEGRHEWASDDGLSEAWWENRNA